jgi:hypothetical protein
VAHGLDNPPQPTGKRLRLSKLIQPLPGQHESVLGRILRPAVVAQQAERAPVGHVLKAPH